MGTKAASKTPGEAELAALRDAVGVTAKDDRTVVFTLATPSVSFLQQLSVWAAAPVRKDVVEKHGDAWTEAANIVGNGPFVLTEWVHNSHLTLEPNPNWHLGKAKLSRVNVRIIEDDIAAFAAYQAGELDLSPIPPANRKEAQTPGSSLNEQLLRKNDLSTFALMFNNKDKPWDNAKVRQAFGTAFDRKTFVEAILQGVGQPTTAWIPPGMPGHDGTAGKQYEFDVAKARQLLSEAGYPNGVGLPKVTLILRTGDMNRLVGQFVQDQYKKNLGVEIDLDFVDAPTYSARFGGGQFNLTFGAWSADWAYPDSWLPGHFGSSGTFNVYHYVSAKVDDLLQRATNEQDAKKQVDLYVLAQKAVIDDGAIVPIYNRETFVLVKPHVRDLMSTGLDGAIRGDWNLWKTWIAKS